MKVSLKTELIPVVLLVAMFVLGTIAWPQAPDRIPIHWGIDGQPDNYAGKFVGLFVAPLIVLGIYGLFFVLPRIDPRRANYEQFWGRYLFIRNLVILTLACIQVITFLWVMDVAVNMNVAVFMVIGFLFIFLGNYMGKLRPTWFVGIRSPWTLSSEESWNKTHRLGGWLFVLVGLAMVIAAPFQETAAFIATGIAMLVMIVVLYVYSYFVWKNDPNRMSPKTRNSRGR